jgi:hypothetical protein
MSWPTIDKTANENKIITYYEILICKTIAKIVSLLDHLVKFQVFNFYIACNKLDILLWCFAKENIFIQVGQLYLVSKRNNCKVLQNFLVY